MICQAPEKGDSLPPVPQYRPAGLRPVAEARVVNQQQFVDAPAGTSHAPLKAPVPDKSRILKSLLQLTDADLAKLLDQLFFERQSLQRLFAVSNVVSGVNGDYDVQAEDTQVQEVSEEAPDIRKVNSIHDTTVLTAQDMMLLPMPPLPTIQFTASMFFANEAEGHARVELMRIGPPSSIEGKTAVVRWETADGSAKAGEKYHATKGEARFENNEIFAPIKIGLVNGSSWDPTLDFYIVLKEEGLENAELHRYHMKCRVKIIDDDAFPTMRYETELLNDKVEDVPPDKLMIEYFKMNFKNRVVRRGTLRCFYADAAKNMLFISLLTLRVLMINNIFMPVLSGEKEWTEAQMSLLFGITLCFFVPDHLIHVLDFRRNYWKVGGASRKTLQANLMRKYMSYTNEVRDKVDIGMVILTLYKGIPELTDKGYSGIFAIVKNLTLLLLLLLYQTLGTRLMGLKTAEPQWVGVNVAVLLVFPVVMLCGLKLRNKKAHRLQSTAKTAEAECTAYTIDALNNYFLLADYGNRGSAIRLFESRIDAFNSALANHRASEVNNKFIPKSLTLSICALWIIFGGILLVDGSIAMGTFLANWTIFSQIGQCWGDIYTHVLEIQECVHDLQILVRLMNHKTETVNEKAFIEGSKKQAREM